jgi:hypothetical protein
MFRPRFSSPTQFPGELETERGAPDYADVTDELVVTRTERRLTYQLEDEPNPYPAKPL